MSDAAYMDAVRRGDLVTAQRLVDAAAKAAGYNVGPVYHGVRERYRMGTESSPPAILPANKFTKWIASEANFPAFYASRDKAAVEKWAKRPSNVMAVYLKAQNTAKEGEIIISSSFLQKEVVDKLKSLGYDSVEGGRDFNAHEIAVFDSSQIKSADPVTYDDAGKVIPLSQRFNSESPDIRNPRKRIIPKQFPYEYAAYLKAHFPDIWKAGGNIRGNDTFRWWSAFRKGDRSPTVMHWWNVTRPAWIARHYRDHRLPGVIAQIKWGTVGTLGVAGMKRVVEDAIRKKL